MAEASLKLGGSWATKKDSLLGFNDENGNYKPIPFDFTRATTATRVNRDGLIEEIQSGVPRIDFTGDGSLLLEPQRTNLVPNSEDFSAGSWTKTNVSITSNATTSPEGIDNAVQITENTSGLNLYAPSDTLSGSASDYTYSVFLKEGSLRYGGLRAINNVFANRFFVNVDLQEGTVTDTETVGSGVTWTYGVESFSDGWYRVWITGTNTSGNIDIAVGLSNSATPNYASGLPYYTGTGSDYIYAYGAQLEVGSYPTSLIKTSGSAVTRNADNCNNTSASSYIGQTEGTVFYDMDLQNIDTNSQYVGVLSDGSSTNRIQFLNNTAQQWQLFISASTISNNINITTSTNGVGRYKIAIAYKSGDVSLYINGVLKGSSTETFTFSSLDEIDLGQRYDDNYFLGNGIKQVLLFKTRLTNGELAELTS